MYHSSCITHIQQCKAARADKDRDISDAGKRRRGVARGVGGERQGSAGPAGTVQCALHSTLTCAAVPARAGHHRRGQHGGGGQDVPSLGGHQALQQA